MMEPREIAETVMGRVVNFCENNRGDTLECLADHNPDQLDTFIDSYLPEREGKELDQAIEKSDTFWDEVKREYEKLWDEKMSLELGMLLSDEMAGLYENIVQNVKLSDAGRAEHLEAYADVLEGFGDAINRALKDKKPLTENELYNWYKKMGDAVFGLKNYSYYEIIGYYTSFYDTLSDTRKLEVLSILLDGIDSVLYDIDKDLEELSESKALENRM